MQRNISLLLGSTLLLVVLGFFALSRRTSSSDPEPASMSVVPASAQLTSPPAESARALVEPVAAIEPARPDLAQSSAPRTLSPFERSATLERLGRLENDLAQLQQQAFQAQRESGNVHETFMTKPGAAPLPDSLPEGRRLVQVVLNPIERFDPHFIAGDPMPVWHLTITPENSPEVFALEDEVAELRKQLNDG